MEWAQAVERDGFAIVPDVVAPAVVARLIAALDAKQPSPATLKRDGRTYAMRDLLTLRVHLDECDATQGPLRLLPGSHTCGQLGAEETRAWLDRVAPVTCLLPRGGVLLMRPLIVHASSPATDPRHRRVVHLEFAAGRLPGNVDWFESPEALLS